jgi:AraC-like DNA-binding protein
VDDLFSQITDWETAANRYGYSVKKLAVCCAISVRHFERLFREKFGRKPSAWLREKRFERAKALLRLGYSTKHVALVVKYKTDAGFCKAFHKYVGLSPQEFVLAETKNILIALLRSQMARSDNHLSHLDNTFPLQRSEAGVKPKH